MEITYSLEPADYWHFSRTIIRRTPGLQRQVIIRYSYLPLILAFELQFLHLGYLAVNIALFVVGTALWISYMMWAQKRSVMRAAQLRPGALGVTTMRLEPASLREQSQVIGSCVKWQNVTEIVESADLVIFLLSPRFGYLVPRRAFSSPEQSQAFLATAQAYWKSARDGTPPMLPPPVSTWPPAPKTLA